MPQKRKQRDEDSYVPETQWSKRSKATPTRPTLQASHVTKSDSFTSSVSRYLTPIANSRLNSTANLTGTAAFPAQITAKALPGQHTGHYTGQSRLIPRGDRRTAKAGHKDETLLRMLCDDHNAGEVKELHFRNMPHSSIDWTNVDHIHKINNWRNQIYGRAGFKSKAVTMWLPDEELWFELYFQLSIAESRMRGILLPKNLRVLAAFNSTFVGCVVRDQNGQETLSRAARQINAFASKFNRMCPELRARLKECTLGMSGDVFVPDITLDMLYAYRKVKVELEKNGSEEQCAISDHLQDWCRQFAQQADTGRSTTSKSNLSMAEDDAAAVLISLSQESAQSEGEDDMFETSSDDADHEEIEDPSNSSMRYFASWNKQGDAWSSTEQASFSSSVTSVQQRDTPVTPHNDYSFLSRLDSQCQYQREATPVCELDIASLIASPD